MAVEKKLDCVILGLLSHEELTGYDIKKRIDKALKYFWGASYGSIYPTLNGLLNDEMVTKMEIKENGRNKAIYSITEKGRTHLKNWLDIPVEKDEIRYETLLKLFFGDDIGEKRTLEHVKSFEMKIRKELPCLDDSVNVLENAKCASEAHKYYLLTAMFGVKVYNAYLEWCMEAEKILGNREK